MRPRPNRHHALLRVIAGLACSAALVCAQTGRLEIRHHFAGDPSDGENPHGALLAVGGALYGLTHNGGRRDDGTLFRVGVDGSDYAVVHDFGEGGADGESPQGALAALGERLFGTTSTGGVYGDGTVFAVGPDGSGYDVLYSFGGGPDDGERPYGYLVPAGGKLVGITRFGGTYGKGTVFAIDPGGSSCRTLHSFAGGSTDGDRPDESVVLAGNALYGVTRSGGTFGHGTIFALAADGTGYRVVHSFEGSPEDGSNPRGTLLISGHTLYGTTRAGGTYGLGTVFRIESDGTRLRVLHSFEGDPKDGENPYSKLVLSGDTLIGTTRRGGTYNVGTLYACPTDGVSYRVLHAFSGGTSDGELPYDSLLASGGRVYGTTLRGGTHGYGILFSTAFDGSGCRVEHSFTGEPGDGTNPFGRLTEAGGLIHGTALRGGTRNRGIIFALSP